MRSSPGGLLATSDRKSTRLNSSHQIISYAVFCLKKKNGVKPRRTTRLALWSGEEQGLRGSRAYVREQFGSFEDPKPAYDKFAGFFKIDPGTGRSPSIPVSGPPAS